MYWQLLSVFISVCSARPVDDYLVLGWVSSKPSPSPHAPALSTGVRDFFFKHDLDPWSEFVVKIARVAACEMPSLMLARSSAAIWRNGSGFFEPHLSIKLGLRGSNSWPQPSQRLRGPRFCDLAG